MAEGVRSGEIGTGLRLLAGTLLRYRRASALSIGSALMWMALVVAIPYLVKEVIDRAIQGADRSLLWPLTGLVVAAGAVKAIGIGGRRLFAFVLSYRAEMDLRNSLFAHVQRLTFTFHDRTSTGQLMARASTDLSQVRLIFAMLPITAANIAMFLLVVTVLLLIDPVLGAAASLTVPALLVAANRYASRVLATSFQVQQRLGELGETVEEGVAGIRVVKGYGQEEEETRRLANRAERIFRKTVELARVRSVFVPIFELIPSLGTVIVLWLGGSRVIDGRLTLGEFVAFTQYLAVLIFPLRITGWFFAELPRSAAAATRVQELIDTESAITDPPQPVVFPQGPGEVVFDGVDFAYADGPNVLHGLDLVIPGGQSVAVMGRTAAGKTTVGFLIPRFHDPDRGRVLLDGVDVRRVRVSELRSRVSLVFEDTFLFSSSIRDNIAFGNPTATDSEVVEAARMAHADGFISELPSGYATVVGERGYSLSGGQRQRIALARAVLRNPRVLILDDAMSSVDAVVEAEIQQALERVMAGRTTIIIAHRASTLALAERVVLIDEGRVVATGTHDELMEASARYRDLLVAGETAGGGG